MLHDNALTDDDFPRDLERESIAAEAALRSVQACLGVSTGATPALPPALNIASLLQCEPAPLDFVLPGLLAGTVGAMVSMGGTGKSFWALQAAATVATPGIDPLKLKPARNGKALVLTLEDPEGVLHHRIHALADSIPEKKRSALATNLTVIPAIGKTLDMMDTALFEDLVQRATGYRLIVIDTLSRIHALDENKAGDAARIIGRMEQLAMRTGAAVLYVHHISKMSATNGMSDIQQAARGSSVLVDNCRWQAFMATMSPQEAKAFGIDAGDRMNYVRWNVSKQNYAPAQPNHWLTRGPTGFFQPVNLRGHVIQEPVVRAPESDLPDPVDVMAAHAQKTGYPLKAPF